MAHPPTAHRNHGHSAADDKYAELIRLLRSFDGVLVAFSGGVDSSLLLKAAHEALGDRVLAVTERSPMCAQPELDAASEVSVRIGVRHRFLDTEPLADANLRANPPDRCYFCKKGLFDELTALAREEGFAQVIEGSNADDSDDFRPGTRAVAEHHVHSPLAKVGLTKREIRALAKAKGLPNWNLPAMACLASRVPHGVPLTEERLRRIGRAEELVRKLGVPQVRVRDHDTVARIEIAPEDFDRLMDRAAREKLAAGFKELGYAFVALDLEGYRMGAMNPVGGSAKKPQSPRQETP